MSTANKLPSSVLVLLLLPWVGAQTQHASLLAALQDDPELSTLTQLVSVAGLNASLQDTATVVNATKSWLPYTYSSKHLQTFWLSWRLCKAPTWVIERTN
jgi:hypothetical protein